jgi:hypothetical protein
MSAVKVQEPGSAMGYPFDEQVCVRTGELVSTPDVHTG